MSVAVERLAAGRKDYARFGGFELEHLPDGSWELYHYGELRYVIDLRGNSAVYLPEGEEHLGISKSDRDNINSLSLLVRGVYEIPPKSMLSKAERDLIDAELREEP